jgi:translation elongation factor EF-Ts
MTREIKDGMYEHLNDFKEKTNRQLSEVKKTMQYIQEQFHKAIEILKRGIAQ